MSAELRTFPGRRAVRVISRTAHIVCLAVLLGGHFFEAPKERLLPWLYGVIATGGVLMATDLWQSWRWFREVRGAATVAKVALLSLVPIFWHARVFILIAVVVIGSVVSHMPGRYRYWVIGQGPRPHSGGRG